jgi:FkbM family methyltransferase
VGSALSVRRLPVDGDPRDRRARARPPTLLKPLIAPSRKTRAFGTRLASIPTDSETPAKALARHLPDRVTIVDGGARFGFGTHFTSLAPHVRLIGFEPDGAECERLADQYAGQLDAILVPLGLGSATETVELQVTQAAHGWSRFAPDLEATSHFRFEPGAVVTDTIEVEFTSLDEWCDNNGIDRVDAIKLDIEGGELDALRGATKCLRDVRALEVEVKFSTLNVGAPLYGEVAAFLLEHGFVPWRFRNQAHYRLKTLTARPRVEEIQYFDTDVVRIVAPAAQLNWCDAVFVAEAAFNQPDHDWRRRLRDAVIFESMDLPDLVIHALQELLAGDAPAAVAAAAEARLGDLSREAAS